MRRSLLLVVVVLAAACATQPIDGGDPPPPTTAAHVRALLADSTEPVVINVWASWCVPCRSEAPLLSRASDRYAGEVRMIGLNVRDAPGGAAGFIAEFFPDADIEHLADADGTIPVELGGSRGVPLTFFYAPGGELRHLHYGVIDERTLALQIDELING
jgi:cytochrome c biogenesis protein CcmG, thiol:disulfide interchange protein DsbE